MKNGQQPASAALPAELSVAGAAPALEVNISADLASVDVMHHGRKVTIMRNQDQDNSINPEFAQTSRKCPPFCIQPSELAPGVKTIAELEVLQFLKQISDGDTSALMIDSRTPAWVDKGIIPGTVSIPWDTLNIGKSEPAAVKVILETQPGARQRDGFWNFDKARREPNPGSRCLYWKDQPSRQKSDGKAYRIKARVLRTDEMFMITRSVTRDLNLDSIREP